VEYRFQWKGKDQDDCTRKELLELLSHLSQNKSQMIMNQIEYEVDRKTRDIKQELKIKDALIEKFIARVQ